MSAKGADVFGMPRQIILPRLVMRIPISLPQRLSMQFTLSKNHRKKCSLRKRIFTLSISTTVCIPKKKNLFGLFKKFVNVNLVIVTFLPFKFNTHCWRRKLLLLAGSRWISRGNEVMWMWYWRLNSIQVLVLSFGKGNFLYWHIWNYCNSKFP